MNEKAQAIVDAAVELPESERASVVDAILQSMDEPPAIRSDEEEVVWQQTLDLAERRAAELRSGRVAGTPAERVHAELDALRRNGS